MPSIQEILPECRPHIRGFEVEGLDGSSDPLPLLSDPGFPARRWSRHPRHRHLRCSSVEFEFSDDGAAASIFALYVPRPAGNFTLITARRVNELLADLMLGASGQIIAAPYLAEGPGRWRVKDVRRIDRGSECWLRSEFAYMHNLPIIGSRR